MICGAPLLLALAVPARGQVNPEQVRVSIDRAVAYLKREQNINGTWPDMLGNVGGVTSLCTLDGHRNLSKVESDSVGSSSCEANRSPA